MKSISILRFVLFHIILPLIVTQVVYIYQKKCENIKINIFIDFFFFFLFILWGSLPLHFNAGITDALSANSGSGLKYFLIRRIRDFIGILSGISYSFLVNFRQTGKYLERLKIDKANFYNLIVLFGVCFVVCFLKLCESSVFWWTF